MAPRVKVTEEQIVDAAFDIVRNEGAEKLTVRSLSQKLHCSTQPILYNFKTFDELKQAVYEKADRYHSSYIEPETGRDFLLELGMNYVRFAKEERNLFAFLFGSGQFSGLGLKDLMEDPQLNGILQILAQSMQVSSERAKEVFLSLFITAHGCASLLAGNAMAFEEDKIRKLLIRAYRGAVKGETEC